MDILEKAWHSSVVEGLYLMINQSIQSLIFVLCSLGSGRQAYSQGTAQQTEAANRVVSVGGQARQKGSDLFATWASDHQQKPQRGEGLSPSDLVSLFIFCSPAS